MAEKLAPTRSGSGPSDAALVVSARSGEMWAKEALFRRHAQMANGLAFRLMGREQDVDDLVQEAFTQALTGLARLENPQAFQSWLCGILVRTAYKTLRRRRLLSRLGFQTIDPIELEAIAHRDAPPDVVRELKEIYARIEKLPPDLRVALVLRRVEGMRHEEIAQATETSIATVKRKIAKAEEILGIGEGDP